MTAPPIASPAPFLTRPTPDEYAPGFAGYIGHVPAGDLLTTLTRQLDETTALLDPVSDERALHRYATGKWSIKEVIGHVIDTERVMIYRILRGARGDRTPLSGFEQDDFTRGTDFDRLPLRELMEQFRLVRLGSLALLRSLTGEELMRRGIANGVEFTPRALAFVIAGHERHHTLQLRDRYGVT